MKTTKLAFFIWTFLIGVAAHAETAYLAGGCFWGMEELLRKEPGVTHTEVGYMGGKLPNATYKIVHTGTSNHAETVKIEFDPKKLSYENLLVFFFKIHDPTTLNRQGNDVGTQYRSQIFYTSEQQKETAYKVINRVNKSKAWGKPVTTVVGKAEEFWKAEAEHQDYLQKNPSGYTCHFVRKVEF
jgi:methionine-S-sulfoxide reductase